MLPMIEMLLKNAELANPIEPGDYIGQDGLYYCGKCNTPKETQLALSMIYYSPLQLPKNGTRLKQPQRKNRGLTSFAGLAFPKKNTGSPRLPLITVVVRRLLRRQNGMLRTFRRCFPKTRA